MYPMASVKEHYDNLLASCYSWMRKSFFRKLRISSQWAKECLLKAGFKVEEYDIENGMTTIIARKR
jgi:phage pi2 protein 07